jgi:hypothetical protein
MMHDLKKSVRKVRTQSARSVGAGNIISQLFFLWMFPFIIVVRRAKDLKKLNLRLRQTESASFNDDLLASKWKAEVEWAAKQNR